LKYGFGVVLEDRAGAGMNAQAIIDAILDKYRALVTYQDFGYVITIDFQGTENEKTQCINFRTCFRRDKQSLFRFEWKHPSEREPSGEWLAAVWSTGKQVFGHYPSTGTIPEQTLSNAIGSGAGALSAGAAHKVPLLLMEDVEEDCGHHFPLDSFTVVGTELILGEKCHILERAAIRQGMASSSVLWISVDRPVLVKVREHEVIDFVRYDAHNQGLLGDDPVANEEIIENVRARFRSIAKKRIEEWAGIEDWRKRAIELGPEPWPKLRETVYTKMLFDEEIENEERQFGEAL
jgi:hypothetical protein